MSSHSQPARNPEYADREIWKIMSKSLPVEGDEQIVIIGQVLSDGRGDWAAMRKEQDFLHKILPDRTVAIIASSATKWEGLLEASSKENEPSHLIYYGNARFSGTSVPLSAFGPEAKIIEKVEQAALIIEAGVSVGEFPKEVIDKIRDKSIKIYEHDAETASGTDTFSGTVLKMGLDPIKDGVFLTSKEEYKWQDLENTNLKHILFEDNNPTMKKIDDYLLKNVCFLCYMSELQSYFSFIGEAVPFAIANSKEKFIDICLPNIIKDKKVGFDESMSKEIRFLQLERFGFDRVKVIWYDGQKQLENTIFLKDHENKKTGQEFRIIDPGSLSPKDFQMMISLSAPLVGCTGDNTLAETLSLGKIPSYEPRFKNKYEALLTAIGMHIGYESALYKYCEYRLKKSKFPPQEIIDPKIIEQAKELGEKIREKSSFEHLLKGVVTEKLLRQKDPDFAKKEDIIRQNYIENKITTEQLKTQVMELLAEKGMLPKTT